MAAAPIDLPSDDPASPERWVKSILQGRQDALGFLFDRFASRVFAIAVRILRNEADAEETVADVFQQVWRDAARFDAARGTVEAWIVRLAHSRAIDRLRRRRARPDEDGVHLDAIDSPYAEHRDPAPELLDALQSESLIREAFRVLGVEQQRCVALAFLEGLSHPEIAARLAMPLGTVKSHVRRGLMAMRTFLQERGHDGFGP